MTGASSRQAYWNDSIVDEEGEPLLNVAGENTEKVPFPEIKRGTWKQYVKSKFHPLSKSQLLLLLYCILLLFFATGNSILFKKMTNHWPNYQYFLTQFSTFIYVPIFFLAIVHQKATGKITPEMTQFPKYKFFVMGALDAVSSILMVFGGNKTRGSTQTLLQQGVIPVTMLMSIAFLKQSYRPAQYLGALLIICGVGVDFYPKAVGEDDSDTEETSFFWAFLFFAANIPSALSSVYKEIAFTDSDLNIYYLQFWVAVWQLAFGLPLAFINTIPLPDQPTKDVSELPGELWDGARCLAGYNTEHSDPSQPEDQCDGAWVPVMLYMLFNINYNILLVLVIKHGSAALMYIVSTVRLPLANIAFSLPLIMGAAAVPMNNYDVAALLVILTGLIIYRAASASSQDLEKEEIELCDDDEEYPPARIATEI
eukprot:TRINITY_DN937_c0_g1::TRINITY_DN937_c0_g1_i1::g.16154::m.16154 TRINITY_DN937_c0_g1::TRINITY_DN937_c0_g1_i1::g.16154  ORF type:complete len:425 (-),score=113.75,sp/Q9GSB0/CRTP1_DICDI/37.16/2e-73,CRT-like/PF08627.5/8.9e-14,CRT-like/PF08627.5/8.3e+03,DUF914/PF06027.7/5.3e-07,DUF914/PF06027.7/11,EamA/PF00892.15/2.9e+02,EamA/PF00892.15/2.7e-05,EamA/PF00892.15/4.2e+03,EamA/PF00892.15/4.3e+03,EmrE/PF13536.1/5.1e+03,EmrE/PF13536.1/3e-05,EmrE/PF13536.1/2.9e+03,EmrE/PF13536.1/4.1e+02,UAA/PF08449.6/31,UAA/P